MTGALCP